MTVPLPEPPPLPPGARKTARGDVVLVCDDPGDLATRTADYLATLLTRAITRHGRAVAALAGGGTPGPTYAELARYDLDWERIELLLTDERLVRAVHPDSNHRMIRRHLGPVPRIWPMVPTDAAKPLDAPALAQNYAERIAALTPRRHHGIPVLDFALLGLGRDGHFASLFPGSPALDESRALVVPAPGPAATGTGSPDRDRLTLTLPLLNASDARVFLVAGAEKAAVVAAALAAEPSLPVTRLRKGAVPCIWFLDAVTRGSENDFSECSRRDS